MSRTGFYSGSFDPPTNGHLDVIERSVFLCDRIVVGIGAHATKAALFTPEERVAMVLEAAGPDQSRDYGRTILRLLESTTEPVATPGEVGILEEKKQLRRRIEMITAHISVKGWPRLAVVLTAALAVIGLTDAKNSNNEKGNMKIGNSIVHAGVIGMLALSTPAPAADAGSPTVAQDMIGTWVLVGKPGKIEKAPSSGGRYKFFTGDHWCITEADPDNGVVVFHHGGTYKFEGGDYVESLEYANPTTMDRIGNTHRYKLSVEKGMLTQVGIDRPDFAEVWRRVASKSGVERSALGTGLQGTWLLTKQDGKETSGELRAYKMITDSSWCDTSYWGKNDVVIYHHGGVFTLKDNRFVEHVVYANPSSMGIIGNASKFDIALDGDTLKMTGIGNPWNEVWERVK
jgi:cytidyltransferase-like protein